MILDARLRELRRVARERGTRALLVVEIPPPPTDPRAAPVPAPIADRADRLAARLGTENPCLVHDARTLLDPGLLAADAGSVPAGGALVLLTPPLACWASGPPASRFVARFVHHLLEHVAAEPATSARVGLPSSELAAFAATASSMPGTCPPPSPTALAAQDRMLERLLAHLRHAERPLAIVEAPRGHGKSALLGRLAARLDGDAIDYAVCAARRAALDGLERHRRRALAAQTSERWPERRSGVRPATPTFLAPDAALARDGDVLLVDEAASLPLPSLERLLGRWRRVVLATTSAGYESAGRAFALRLPAALDRERPGWLHLAPPEPMRWRAGDPLDALVTRILLAPSSAAANRTRTRGRRRTRSDEGSAAPATEIDRDALVADEPRLARLFGLLTTTHYQSTPLDLVHLLDAAPLRLWSVERDGTVLGAALVAVEPGIASELRADVLARRRRLPHRLLPQLLAQSADRGDALGARCARIVRIAVAADARRQGIGNRLVAAVVRATADDVEAIGASFGETAATRAFWSANGFTAFHRGGRRNPRSGQRSVAVLTARSARVRDVLATAVAIHRDNVRAARDASVADALDPPVDVAPAAHDARLLRRFADGERSLSDTLGALSRLIDAATAPAASRRRVVAVGEGTSSGRGASEHDIAARWLHALGLDVSPSGRGRERGLRDWVRLRLSAEPAATDVPPGSRR